MAEWTAAGLGLVLTLGVLGYSLWEGLTQKALPPSLTVMAEAAERTAGGWVLPITIRNDGPATAAAVEVSGVLEQAGTAVETRRTSLAYVPGGGQTKGGLIFQRDPGAYDLKIAAEGYEEP